MLSIFSCVYWPFACLLLEVCKFKSITPFYIGLVFLWLTCRSSLYFLDIKPISEKAMAPHSSTLAWKIPWTEEPGGLQSMRSLRVGHDWATSLSLFTFMHWKRKWQPTPVFLPGESQGRGSLVVCHLWGCTESDTTEAMQQQQAHIRYVIYKYFLPYCMIIICM